MRTTKCVTARLVAYGKRMKRERHKMTKLRAVLIYVLQHGIWCWCHRVDPTTCCFFGFKPGQYQHSFHLNHSFNNYTISRLRAKSVALNECSAKRKHLVKLLQFNELLAKLEITANSFSVSVLAYRETMLFKIAVKIVTSKSLKCRKNCLPITINCFEWSVNWSKHVEIDEIKSNDFQAMLELQLLWMLRR